jgi:hypothetical protein
VEPNSAPADVAAGERSAPPRQRWRLVVARSADAPRLAGRELAEAWEAAIEATGLPLHRSADRARARVAFAAPLQLGAAAERELADIFLTERTPVWRVHEALDDGLPAGWSLVELFDVWVGGPPLAGRVIAAQYRIVVDGTWDPDAVAAAASALLAAERLPRNRLKGGSTVAYDLRPLLAQIGVLDPGPPVVLRVRTRIHPELGTGRPEEVLAAIAEGLGYPLAPTSIVRERLILMGEPG